MSIILTPAGRRTLLRAAGRIDGAIYPSSIRGGAQEKVHIRLERDGLIVKIDNLWTISDKGREVLRQPKTESR